MGRGSGLALAGHAEVETYSVLTRFVQGLGTGAASAWSAVRTGFTSAVHPVDPARTLERIATARVTGGMVYDALVALAALDVGLPLATRDKRALPTYSTVNVSVVLVA